MSIEDDLNQRFNKARDEQDAADKALDDHYRPLVMTALANEDHDEVEKIMSNCSKASGSLTYIFLFDRIRQAKLKR